MIIFDVEEGVTALDWIETLSMQALNLSAIFFLRMTALSIVCAGLLGVSL